MSKARAKERGVEGPVTNRPGPADHRDLVRLVRYVAGHSPVRAETTQGETVFHGAGGRSRPFAEALAHRACALGLIVVSGASVHATPEATPFLRRALLAPDDAFQEQHRLSENRIVSVEGTRETVRVNVLESPLGAVARLKEKSGQAFLPPEAIAAGERLHADFTRARLQPRLTMTYEPRLSAKTKGRAGGTADLSDTALAARLRVGRAMEAVGPELCGVALDVCCFEKGLETVERERQWPARSAKLMLRTALMALSRHYAPPPPRTPGRQSHVWGADGFRPEAGDLVATPPAAGQPRP